jgi:hypothetical protein
MPCSFGLLPHPRSEAVRPAHRPLYLTVSVRWLPLVTAAYGMRVARPVGTMWFAPVGEGSPLAGRVWLTAGDDGLVGKPRSGAAASGRLGSRSVEPPAQLPSVGSRNDDPGFRYRERQGDQPSWRSLIFRGATGPDDIPRPTREDGPKSIRVTYLYIIVSTDYQSARFKG